MSIYFDIILNFLYVNKSKKLCENQFLNGIVYLFALADILYKRILIHIYVKNYLFRRYLNFIKWNTEKVWIG